MKTGSSHSSKAHDRETMKPFEPTPGRFYAAPRIDCLRKTFQRLLAPSSYLEDVFTEIYREKHWGDGESASGTGSGPEGSARVRALLPALLRTLGGRSLLDVPCGDFHWMRMLDLQLDSYVGADIVRELIERNTQLYAGPSRRFVVLDLTKNRLPAVDVILCRDGLGHLSNRDSLRAIRNIQHSGSRCLMATTFPQLDRNRDICSGQWRPMNLQLAPFHFPPPLALHVEESLRDAGYPSDKALGIWSIADLAAR